MTAHSPGCGDIILGDGAWGTALRGMGAGDWVEACNVEQPAMVRALAEDYVAAGAGYLLSNTFCANRLHAVRQGGDGLVAVQCAEAGARISREAMGPGGAVLGAMGPAQDPAAPVDNVELAESYREQAAALLRGGCDGILLETFGDLAEARLALDAVQESGAKWIGCSFSFDETGTTYRDATLEDCVALVREGGIDAFGCNCMLSPEEMTALISRARLLLSDDTLLLARPCANAGGTALLPEAFASGVVSLAEAGATMLGGCCGSTPAHIAAAADALTAACFRLRPLSASGLRGDSR